MAKKHNDAVARPFACVDCGRFGLGYMLRDSVWQRTSARRSQLLCMGCVERRLGRALETRDFADVPLNLPIFHMLGAGVRTETE